MEAYNIRNLTFAYPEAEETVLKNISFTVNRGEFITLCGPSGCGKSTLLRCLKPVISPAGRRSGKILFFGKDIEQLSHREQCAEIGYVLQSPDNQLVTVKVWHELAFGLESLGESDNIIRRRVAESAAFFGMEHMLERSVNKLSGGQKQLLNLASVMAMQPEVLILDEPTSALDPIAAGEFLSCVSKINREFGTTVIIAEHRLEEVIPICSRVMVMDSGEIISFDVPEKVGENLKNSGSKYFNAFPAEMRIWAFAGWRGNCPVTVAQGRNRLEAYAKDNKLNSLYPEVLPPCREESACVLKNIWFRYSKDGSDVLKDLSLSVKKGEFLAVLGGNGAGKSTLLSLIAGIYKPYRGKASLCGGSEDNAPVVLLPQNPREIFVKKTVAEDLAEVFDGRKISKSEIARRINNIAGICRLEKLLSMHPYDLSGGEQQMAALAKLILLRPRLLLLDEPTKGLDCEFKKLFAKIINTLTKSGTSVLMVSHDVEFCAQYAHRCAMLFNGEIVSQDSPRKFFSSNSFYVTSATRISRGIIDKAVTVNDVVYCCTGIKQDENNDDIDLFFGDAGEITEQSEPNGRGERRKMSAAKKIIGITAAVMLVFGLIINLDYISVPLTERLAAPIKFLFVAVPVAALMFALGSKSRRPPDEARTPADKRKLSRRTVIASAMVLIAVPLTVFIGVTYLNNQKYLFISLLVMFECMLPFFLVFEGRKPRARELVILAVMCAAAVAGRAVFYMLPQFKPTVAVIVITGIAFGAESGFMVGAVSMLVSNIMFGQGPWTPWQMFAMGIIGFLAGLLFKKGLLSRNRAPVCLFGFASTVVIYGAIMNFESAVMSGLAETTGSVWGVFAAGLPFDIAHGLATLAFLFFGAEPMLEKLDRVKVKYGLKS